MKRILLKRDKIFNEIIKNAFKKVGRFLKKFECLEPHLDGYKVKKA